MKTDITAMTYPMLALGDVSIGKLHYKAGETFDAMDIKYVNFFKKRAVARVIIKPVATRKAVDAPTDVVQTEVGTASPVDSVETQDAPADTVGAEGTQNASQETQPTAGATAKPATSRRKRARS